MGCVDVIKFAFANCLVLLLSLIGLVSASDGSLPTQFLGSPLLILGALLVIDTAALAYHRLRK
jgi:hypothetical protein